MVSQNRSNIRTEIGAFFRARPLCRKNYLVHICLLPALLWGLAVFSQAQTFLSVEQRTFELFKEKDWSGLIREGKAALREGYDYLGLHYRMGVAYYEQRKYYQSSRHFERALQYDHFNRYTLEYLYYSYCFSGREKDARRLAQGFPAAMTEKIGVKENRLLDFLYLEGGLKQSNLRDSIGSLPFLTLGMRHRLGYNFDIYQAVSYLKQVYFQMDFRQWEYYLRADWQLARGITFHPALHYAGLDGKLSGGLNAIVDNPIAQSVWSGYFGLSITPGRWRMEPYYAAIRSETETSYFSENPPYLLRSSLTTQQFGVGVAYALPFWKDRLWLTGRVAAHLRGEDFSNLWGGGLSAYFSPAWAIHLSYFSGGDATQLLEAKAAILNNSLGVINNRWAASLESRLARNSSLFLGYQREDKATDTHLFYYDVLFLGLKLGL